MKNRFFLKTMMTIVLLGLGSAQASGEGGAVSVNTTVDFHMAESFNSIFGIRRLIARNYVVSEITKVLEEQGCTNIVLEKRDSALYRYMSIDATSMLVAVAAGIRSPIKGGLALILSPRIAREGDIAGNAMCPTPLRVTGHVKHYSKISFASFLESRNKIKLEVCDTSSNARLVLIDQEP